MAFLLWNDDLDVKVEAMNQQHKELIRLMNLLFDKQRDGSLAELTKYMTELKAYTLKHFREEEAFMAAKKYSDLENHKKLHLALLAEFEDHEKEFGKSGKIPQGFFRFLSSWLLSHIKAVDTKYS